MKESYIPTLLAIAILLVGIVDGVIFTRNRNAFRVNASLLLKPTNARLSNISDTSFTVSWITQKESVGFIRWGLKDSNLNKIALDTNTKPSKTHFVEIKGLSPYTLYYYSINSGNEEFDNNGKNWQVTTGKFIPEQSEANIISGRVLSDRGQPIERAIVFATIGGSSPQSTTTSSEGLWTLNIAAARTLSLENYIDIENKTTPIEIQVQSDNTNLAFANTNPVSAKPVPPIIMGKTHNFKNLLPDDLDYIPEAQIDFP